MTKIYTKTGDDGTTSLFDGTRVKKDNPRVDAYGDVDELNSVLGVAASFIKDEKTLSLLYSIQRDLFAFGANMANPKHKKQKEKSDFTDTKITFLEKEIDAMEEKMEPLKAFILPGGSHGSSFLHMARTVCRRAERNIIGLSESEEIDAVFIKYINRLSDFLFVLARFVNFKEGVKDVPWDS
ncbi:cob(I)yrinic acid a,c-diamide adenosyltransferase [bacterium]|nr:cob(I)yrinic acid a,c-diamide adenosyltransferase [bacterium]